MSEKALIPLPPTGFVSVFCAKGTGGAIGTPAQPGWGLRGVFVDFTECKVLQRSAVALHIRMGRRRFGQGSETPGLQGLRLRKPAAEEVFVFGTVHTRCELMTAQPNCKTAVRPSPGGSPVFCGIAQYHHEFSGM